jgi:pyrroloquinoline quinone biosynthesis protein D
VIPTHPKLSRRFRLQYEEAQTRWVLLYPEGMVQLNDSAAEILKRCNGERTVAEIVSELEAAFSVQGLTTQVESLIEEGGRRGWID